MMSCRLKGDESFEGFVVESSMGFFFPPDQKKSTMFFTYILGFSCIF